jgi:hypothetical protein
MSDLCIWGYEKGSRNEINWRWEWKRDLEKKESKIWLNKETLTENNLNGKWELRIDKS